MSKISIERRFLNGRRYATYEFSDETSAFDPLGTWEGGSDYYSRTYRVRVPRGMLEKALSTGDYAALSNWLESHNDRGIWL